MKDLIILVPVYNEQESIELFFKAVEPELEKLGLDYGYLFVDDGSKDNTLEVLKAHAAKNPAVKYISLSRNFGKEAAMLCGLQHTHAKSVVPMDIDLQDPPAVIADFVAKWKEGYDMVYGVRADRTSDGFIKKLVSESFYKIHNIFAPRPLPHNTGDFRLLDAKVLAAIKKIDENTLFMKGLFNWVGFKSIGVQYTRPKRSAGATKWSYWKLWNFALDGIFNASTLPLRLWTYFGAVVAMLSFVYAAWIILKVFMYGKDVPGYASLAVLILFFGGVQLISIGVLGEYIGRIFAEAKRRPAYIINESSPLAEAEDDGSKI